MVDADADVIHRWTQVKSELERVGVALPDAPTAGGTIVPGIQSGWRVGVWLMPDNQNRGQLEDFLGKLIPANDACWPHACDATRRAQELGARFPEQVLCKANIHTWLAWQESPGLPFGMAITAKYFTVDSAEALAFVGWFKQLFF